MSELEKLVKHLSDPYEFNWTRVISHRGAADIFLQLLVDGKFIEGRDHPYGGKVWKVGRKLYGRTDGVSLKSFKEKGLSGK